MGETAIVGLGWGVGRELKQRDGFGLKESRTRAHDGTTGCERRGERERERRGSDGGGVGQWESSEKGGRRGGRERRALATAMGVPLPGSCEVKSLPWF